MRKKKNTMQNISEQSMNEVAYACDEAISADEFTWVGQDIEKGNVIVRESVSYFKDALRRLFHDKVALTLMIILGFILFMSILMPIISQYSMSEICDSRNLPPFSDDIKGNFHILGTDNLGRDSWTRLWYGGRISLLIAFVAVGINCVVGIIYGGISGYFGGWIDNIMMRIVEIVSGIPYLLIVILLMTIMKPSISTIIIAYALVGWVGMARLVRGQVMQLKEQEFVISAQTMGASAGRILLHHLVPNTLSVIIVNLTLAIPSAIFTEAYLSFIGLGVPLPQASWGTLANDGIINFRYYPEQLLIPAILISLTMLGFNLLGDKLRDAFDPKLRR